MNIYIYTFLTLTIFPTILLSSSQENFKPRTFFRTAATAKIAQQESPLTPASSSTESAKPKPNVDKDITPDKYKISRDKLFRLEQELAANRIAIKREVKNRIEEIRKLVVGYENYTGEIEPPFFTDVFEEERTRSGSPDIRLMGHYQSGTTTSPEYQYRKRYWKDTSSAPSAPLTRPTKVLSFKDDILSNKPSEQDMFSRKEVEDLLAKKMAKTENPQE